MVTNTKANRRIDLVEEGHPSRSWVIFHHQPLSEWGVVEVMPVEQSVDQVTEFVLRRHKMFGALVLVIQFEQGADLVNLPVNEALAVGIVNTLLRQLDGRHA
jgi:hypothetical protein